MAAAQTKHIDFLFWEGCPSHPEARQLLSEVVAETGATVEIEEREVMSDAEAAELHFPGSPTIRVDGVDVDPAGADRHPSLSCRIYHLPDGRVSPVPSRKQLEDALR